MMTGNVVFLGRSLTPEQASSPVLSAPYYLVVMMTFFIGALTYRLAEARWPSRGASTLGLPFGLMMLGAELVLKMGWTPQGNSLYPLTIVAYAPMFGVLNAACAAGQLATPTTMTTGHLLTLAASGAKLCRRQKLTHVEKTKVMMSMLVSLSIFAGAVLGGFVYWVSSEAGTHGALLPVAPALALLFWLHDHLAKPRRLAKKLSKLRRAACKSPDSKIGNAEVKPNNDECEAESGEDSTVDLELGGEPPEADATPRAATSAAAGPEKTM
eukprot:CAMPEP_0115307984 /NCGR_PEP_ID=MMETSP0270-20121206/73442_1 /TAXON_ID=71861 /ORGANISM="Scrippsiella trochoidea, Strain CCMP3099" /LENGTH=268 /DNA_ID=CAMNT_0002726483 /DNA_START=172 /DNA_END=978 /DNA_ORIENTATION=+